jgi:hypothetical protein
MALLSFPALIDAFHLRLGDAFKLTLAPEIGFKLGKYTEYMSSEFEIFERSEELFSPRDALWFRLGCC